MQNENTQPNVQTGTIPNDQNIYIEVTLNGPYVLHGPVPMALQYIVANEKGISVAYNDGESFKTTPKTYLCRCGLSKHKPYCDQSHLHAAENGVNLTETASFNPSLQTAEIIEGPVVSLTDDEKLCAYARFCDNGKRIWNEVEGNTEHAKDASVKMAHLCPSGRLVIWNNTDNTPIENKESTEVGLIEDTPNQCSGPIALWGGIPVKSASGGYYEVRNRQTLCRCGQSSNKPFCDGTHASMSFQDGLADYEK